MCSGSISSYRYCYNSVNNESRSSINTAVFALYRSNSDSTGYSKVSDSITISEPLTEPQNCATVELSPSISVVQGDILGACIDMRIENSTQQASLIGNNTDPNTKAFLLTGIDVCNSSIPSSIQRGSLANTTGLVLQLSASISNSSSNASLQVGEIVGIVIPLVALLIIAALVVTVYWLCKSRYHDRPLASSEPLLPHNPGFGEK